MSSVGNETSAALGAGVGAVGAVLVIGLVLVILVVANRAEPDQRGYRSFTVYLFAISFLALFAAYFGTIVIVQSVLHLFAPHYLPVADEVANACVVGLIVMVISLGTLRYHLRRGIRIAHDDERVDGPNARILHTYVSAVVFIATAVAVVASGVAVYKVFGLISPTIFEGSHDRGAAFRSLLLVLYVVVGALLIAFVHLRWAPPQIRPSRVTARPSGAPPAGGLASVLPTQPSPPTYGTPPTAEQPPPYVPPPPAPPAPPPPLPSRLPRPADPPGSGRPGVPVRAARLRLLSARPRCTLWQVATLNTGVTPTSGASTTMNY